MDAGSQPERHVVAGLAGSEDLESGRDGVRHVETEAHPRLRLEVLGRIEGCRAGREELPALPDHVDVELRQLAEWPNTEFEPRAVGGVGQRRRYLGAVIPPSVIAVPTGVDVHGIGGQRAVALEEKVVRDSGLQLVAGVDLEAQAHEGTRHHGIAGDFVAPAP